MSNTVFAIVHLKYNADRALTGLNQTRFQITNSRKAPGDCFLDYLSSERYGAAISLANILAYAPKLKILNLGHDKYIQNIIISSRDIFPKQLSFEFGFSGFRKRISINFESIIFSHDS